MIKLICNKCASDIREFQVLTKHICHATNYVVKEWVNTIYKKGQVTEREIVWHDREYLDGCVNEVLFRCPKCGIIKVTKKECENIEDFVRDISKGVPLPEEDLKSDNYGPIIVQRKC